MSFKFLRKNPATFILLQHQERRLPGTRRFSGKAGPGCALLLSLIIPLAIVGIGFLLAQLGRGLPSLDRLPALLDPPNGLLLQPTRFYDRTGQHLLLSLEHAEARRKYLSLDISRPDHLPEILAMAVIARSDPNFWRHAGFSLEGILDGEHPTLAQRLVSVYLLGNEEPGLWRNLRERLLAYQVTTRFGRAKMLEWYLNSADFGHLAIGAEAAAQLYFSKPAAQLNLAEAAFLAAIAADPSLDPFVSSEPALRAQRSVIQTLLDQNLITEAAAEQSRSAPLNIRTTISPLASSAQEFTDLALEQLPPLPGFEKLELGGLRVITTLDYQLQEQADCATQAYLAQHGANYAAEGSDDCPAASLLAVSPAETGTANPGLKAEVVVLEPSTGQVLALVRLGASGNEPAAVRRLIPHRGGTLVAPFIYLTGFTHGMGPATLLWDLPPEEWNSPGNFTANQFHGPIRLRIALANDYLEPGRQVLEQVGLENVFFTSEQLGIPFNESLVYGSNSNRPGSLIEDNSATLLEFSSAYGILANLGIQAGQATRTSLSAGNPPNLSPTAVLRVEDIFGQVQLDWSKPVQRSVTSPELAYLINHILKDEASRWPSLGHPNPSELGRPAGVKLGQVPDGQDAWTVGYTPQVLVGTWMGRDLSDHTNKLDVERAAILWRALMQYAVQSYPPQDWKIPAGIAHFEVCDPSGMLPTPLCPTLVDEVFLSGNEPVHPDNFYRAYQVDRQTGRLATVFTPLQRIESRVYMDLPATALAWARQANLALPPESYDSLSGSHPPSDDVRITYPAMDAVLKGQLLIRGSAKGKGFASYSLQYGKGLNPQEWFQIGPEKREMVEDGWLGTWDTRDLSGLYAFRLQVIREDRHLETDVLLVSIDNQLPEVNILNPSHGQDIQFSEGDSLVLVATVEDNLGKPQAEFYLDGRRIGTLGEPPFALAWKASPGDHILLVKGIDRAGNTQEASAEFTMTLR